MDEDAAVAYERTMLMLFREHLVGRAQGIPREILSVHLSGSRPDTQLIIRYRDLQSDATETVRWWVWEDVNAAQARHYSPPDALVANFIHLWNAFEINPDE